MKRTISEKEFLRQVLQLAGIQGFLRAHFFPATIKDGQRIITPQAGDMGFPDLVLVHPLRPKLIFAELKVGKGQTSIYQDQWLAALELSAAAPVETYLWRPEAWCNIELALGVNA